MPSVMAWLLRVFPRPDVHQAHGEITPSTIPVPGLPGVWHAVLPGEPLVDDGEGVSAE
jgi:hypothetical protein